MGKIAVGFSVFLFTVLTVSAQSSVDAWKLVHTSGEVTVSNGLRAGDTLPAATTVSTGQDGRALLVRGGAAMLIGPGTTLSVDISSRWIIEQGGHARPERSDAIVAPARETLNPEFVLDQPVLAAVVKA
jgi:hypothetical protein